MKRLLALSIIFILTTTIVHAQEAPAVPDTLNGWTHNWTLGFNGSQAAYSNWSQGGVNNLALAGNSLYSALYRQGRFSYAYQLNTRYGQTRIDGEGVRKTDDRLSIRNRFLYDLEEENSDFKVFGNINFRTQFDEGFQYGAGPNGENILISNFMAPAYFSQNAGLAYVPTENFSFEAGLGLQQTIVRDESLSTTYGLDEGQTFKNEAGVNLSAGYSLNIATNLNLSTSVETFTSLNKSVRSTDVQFLNQVTGRINNFMNTSLRLDIIYDDDFSNEIQVAQVLSLGISFILIE